MAKLFTGTGIAIITPFKKGNIDWTSFEKLIEFNINGGVDFIVFLGTTGESATLTKAEKNEILTKGKSIVNGQVPIVAGVGGNNTQAIIDDLKSLNIEGYNGILSVSPAYNKPSQRGIIAHFEAVAQATDLPIIAYNVPSRTGSNMTAETTLYLANNVKNIVAIKEASGDVNQCMKIAQYAPKDFTLLSGDDALVLPLIATGFDGVISVVAQAYPEDFSNMVNLALIEKIKKAQKLHYRLLNIIDLMFADGNPPGVKEVLMNIGLCSNECRLPVVPVNESVAKAIKAEVKKLA